MKTRVEEYARHLDPATTASVRAASAAKVAARVQGLREVFTDPEAARTQAAAAKSYVLDNLPDLLEQFEQRCLANGIQVHWAKDAASAKEQILQICEPSKGTLESALARNDPASEQGQEDALSRTQDTEHRTSHERPGTQSPLIIVKAKSMATEEIHLNEHLEQAGFEVVETDLGEFVVQINHDTPSHIVTPIIHKSKRQVAESFAREGLGPYTEVAEELTMQARAHLRDKFRRASIGVSGVNFGIASSGSLVIIENEGNNRYSTTAPRVHIAVMGLEKLVPTEEDLAVFLPLLACSATGQHITTYVHFIRGPRQRGEPDGPEEVHLILLDNGRSRVLNGPYRDILRCIRCGACLNVCPVYRDASGHGYGHVYSGPLGAVLAPALEGIEKMGDLPKASSLCGACEEVCPVKIPIPHMLLQLRDEAFRAGLNQDGIPWGAFATGASSSRWWRLGLSLLPMAESLPSKPKSEWTEFRAMPQRQGGSFRRWWNERKG